MTVWDTGLCQLFGTLRIGDWYQHVKSKGRCVCTDLADENKT